MRHFLIAVLVIVVAGNAAAQERGRQIKPSEETIWRYTERQDSTWEDVVRKAVYMDGLMPGYLATTMTLGVISGHVRDDGGAWTIGIPDSMVWPAGALWDQVILPNEALMLGRFKFAPFRVNANGDTVTQVPSYFGYKQISVNKANGRVTVRADNRRNPAEAFMEQILSPQAYVAPGLRVARFKANEKRRRDEEKKRGRP